jgi:endoglucanase
MRTTGTRRWVLGALFALVAVVAALAGLFVGRYTQEGAQRAESPPTFSSLSGLKVDGNQLVDGPGNTVRLLGFNTSGTEYACVEGWGIFDLPGSEPTRVAPAVVERMTEWRGANTVRVPLNEQCWLGLGVDPAYGGSNYQRAIDRYVNLLESYGFAVVLDLHRSAPADGRSVNQEQMPDRDHSLDFWRQVATAYKDDTAVVFDLFNEPWPLDEPDSARAWQCWRDGGCELTSTNGAGTYTAAGMNEIITTIRSTGAGNVLAVGGIYWAEMLDRWLEYRPTDPANNLIAAFHNYQHNKYCHDEKCYDTVLASVAAKVPLYAGEVGPDVTAPANGACPLDAVGHTGFSERILDWLDDNGAGYTPWTWNAWDDCYSLVTDDRGTPTPLWGREVRARLAADLKSE